MKQLYLNRGFDEIFNMFMVTPENVTYGGYPLGFDNFINYIRKIKQK